MARNLAIVALALFLGLALWFWRGAAAGVPLAAPDAPVAAKEVAPPAQTTEATPSAVRHEEAAPAAAPAPTVIAIICRAKETGAPLAGQSVHAYAERTTGPVPARELAESGANGRVELEVPPARTLHVDVYPKVFGANSSASREIEPLHAGEEREVVIELATQTDSRFCARVIARETKQPIGAVEVRGVSGDITTDSDGRFDVPYSTWSLTRLTILARGYAEVSISAQAGHETPEKALVLELERSCTLVGLLKDGGNGRYVLRVLTEGYRLQEQDPSRMTGAILDIENRTWSADFDASGRAEIPGLPPNAPLRVSLYDGRKPLAELPERVTIPPGATREVELRASSCCTLKGSVRDDAGKPVAGLTLWLLRAERGIRLYVRHFEGDELVATAKTDADGRFSMAKVSAGTWRLSPEAKLNLHVAEVGADEVAPLAMLVEIPAGVAEHQVELLVHRGLTITGKVLDPDGKPATQTNVSADQAPIYINSNGRAEGSFVLGPLAPGSYRLQASAYFSSSAPSEEVSVEAGARDVVLQLRRGGKLAGRVIDAKSGEGVVAQIAVSAPANPKAWIHMPTSKPDGSFELSGLLPGTYALCAATGDGRAGSLRGVELAAGGDLRDLVIEVRPGARLRVRYEGEQEFCNVSVRQDGAVVATDGVEKSTSKTFSVPTGEIKLVCRLGGNGKEIVRELSLTAGQEQELVIKDQD